MPHDLVPLMIIISAALGGALTLTVLLRVSSSDPGRWPSRWRPRDHGRS